MYFTIEYNHACVQNKVEKNRYRIFISVAVEDFHKASSCTGFSLSSRSGFSSRGPCHCTLLSDVEPQGFKALALQYIKVD